MNKFEYLKTALKAGVYMQSEWIQRAFASSNLPTERAEGDYAYRLYNIDGSYAFFNPDTGDPISLGIPVEGELFFHLDGVDITPEEVANCRKAQRVSVGNLLVNYIVLIYPFGSTIEFVTGQFDIGAVEKQVGKLVADTVPEEERKAGVIYIDDLIKFIDAAMTLDSYNTIFVPSATPYTMTASPEALAYIDKFLVDNKDKLNDPVVIAGLTKKVAELDRAYIDSDPDKGFYRKAKSFNVIRMRIHYLFGIVEDFHGSGEHTFIKNPLAEGWDMSKLPEMNNSSRDGSFSRGAETAIGGEKVKTSFRNMGGTTASAEDCGTQIGIYHPKLDAKSFLGCYVLDKGGSVLLDESTMSTYDGRGVYVRGPGACLTVEGNFCIKCCGEWARGRENTIAALCAEPASTLMGATMGAMHGKALRTVDFNPDDVIS